MQVEAIKSNPKLTTDKQTSKLSLVASLAGRPIVWGAITAVAPVLCAECALKGNPFCHLSATGATASMQWSVNYPLSLTVGSLAKE